MTVSRCILLGSGGHAAVVLDAAVEAGTAHIVGALDADAARWGTRLLGIEVLGGDNLLAELATSGRVDAFIVGVGCVRPGGLRQRLFERAVSLGLTPVTVVHPKACISRWAELGVGSVALAASVVNAGARVGANAIINTGAIVEHDCRVADHAHIATGAKLAGNVLVGSGSVVGAGAVVREGIGIGVNAMVAAGAVVIRPVVDGAVVAGVPAKAICL